MDYFISYAQNGEDILLHRALKDVAHGFYVDVGAQDPVEDSVTKAFYERGWRGINIEPVQHWHERLVADRPHDINLQVAASDHSGELELFEIPDSGLSTSDAEFARRHTEAGLSVRETRVSCETLDQICVEHAVKTVHFLKIDCEGAEQQVLRGISLDAIRPWIIVVEATKPNSSEPTWQGWEHLLTGRNYSYVYSDGLSRYYIAQEHAQLRDAFQVQPNPLDWALRASEVRAHEAVKRLSTELTGLRSAERIGRIEAEREYFRSENERREAALKHLRSALRVHQEQLAEVTSARDHLHRENERREAALGLMRVAEEELKKNLEILAAERECLEQELVREGLAREALRSEVRTILASHSWRITAPLRACAQCVRRIVEIILAAVWAVASTPAHLAKPMLRALARQEAIRALIVGTLGGNSRLLKTARLFLFGTAQSAHSGEESQTNPEMKPAPAEYSRQERQVLAELQRAMADPKRERT